MVFRAVLRGRRARFYALRTTGLISGTNYPPLACRKKIIMRLALCKKFYIRAQLMIVRIFSRFPQAESALMFDSVYVFAKGLAALDQGYVLKPANLSCDLENPWEDGLSLYNYINTVGMEKLNSKAKKIFLNDCAEKICMYRKSGMLENYFVIPFYVMYTQIFFSL
jgi:hypothetical protein